MACNLTKGRNLSCRDGIGGVKAIYFAQHDELTSYVAASGEMTDFDMGSGDDIYKYLVNKKYKVVWKKKYSLIFERKEDDKKN